MSNRPKIKKEDFQPCLLCVLAKLFKDLEGLAEFFNQVGSEATEKDAENKASQLGVASANAAGSVLLFYDLASEFVHTYYPDRVPHTSH